MSYTWLQAAEILGFRLHVSAPQGYRLDPERINQPPENILRQFDDPMQACAGAHLVRSEEHTSELQSLMRISYAVFCLKKKTTQNRKAQKHDTTTHTKTS